MSTPPTPTKTRKPRKQRTLKRAALDTKSSTRVSFPMPKSWVKAINEATTILDTDKSKLIRAALREKLAAMGVNLPPMTLN